MELYELVMLVNDNTVVEIYDAESGEPIGCYDGKDSIPEELDERNVSDVFVDQNKLCIEIV